MSTWDRSPNALGRAISPSLTPPPPARRLLGPTTISGEERLGLMPCLLVSLCAHGLPRPSHLAPVPTGPAQSGILVDREVVSLFLHFTVNPKPRVDFIDRPRCCLRGKECSINRFQQVESRWGYSGTSDRIRWAGQVTGAGPGWGLPVGRGGAWLVEVTQHLLPSIPSGSRSTNASSWSASGSTALSMGPQITK